MNCDNRSNNHWIVLSPVASYLIIYNRTNSSESRHNSLLHSRLAGRFCSIMKCVPSISLYYPFCKHATSCTPFASSLFCRLIPFSIYFSSRASMPPPLFQPLFPVQLFYGFFFYTPQRYYTFRFRVTKLRSTLSTDINTFQWESIWIITISMLIFKRIVCSASLNSNAFWLLISRQFSCALVFCLSFSLSHSLSHAHSCSYQKPFIKHSLNFVCTSSSIFLSLLPLTNYTSRLTTDGFRVYIDV